jgi:endonuclease/exonuclease/phosphatase family metal-dependent hydrolase
MEEIEQEVVMLDRRQFLSRIAAGVGVALAATHPSVAQLANMPAKLPDPAQFSNDQEVHWPEIRMETGSFLSAAESYSPGHEARVISWNINRGQQLDEVLQFLHRTPADLILLQETDVNARRTQHRNIAREIAQALRMNYVFGREFQELTQGNHSSPAYHGQATLSRFPILSSRILTFSRQSGFWRPRWFIPQLEKSQRRLGGRMALVSHVGWSEKHLLVYNLHLESRGSDQLRSSQLAEVVTDIHQYGSGLPVVVGGDFNFELSREPAISVVNGAWLQNPFNHGNRRPTVTRPRLGRPGAIDCILVGGPLSYGSPELYDSVVASDHYPLSVAVQIY